METPEAGKHVHDPVSAISESEATGETAAIFTDIRRCMKIPLLTSIWRTLAGIEGGLSAVWRAAKPLVESGRPAAAVQQLRDPNKLPVPEPLVEGQLACAGVEESQLFLIRSLIDAYNRSNGINLITPPSSHPSTRSRPIRRRLIHFRGLNCLHCRRRMTFRRRRGPFSSASTALEACRINRAWPRFGVTLLTGPVSSPWSTPPWRRWSATEQSGGRSSSCSKLPGRRRSASSGCAPRRFRSPNPPAG